MIGSTLSHYEVLEKLGEGGMGVVYRARDTKLGREVAIKILPAGLGADDERLSRFEREARLLASLNHPNVATLHGFEEDSGTRFLVMELVEGETLADRIARAPLPVDEVVDLFAQIAEGLEAAHAKGVVHRDLKPANVKITPEGQVKVLDFGLAKVLEVSRAGSHSESPTVTRSPTESGVILGTAAYMSPEQARGKPVDKRTDVWSLGCCLFEALGGRAAFLGETVTDTLAKILETEPDWRALPATTPSSIRRLLERCLTKDPKMRFHDVADARIELTRADETPAAVRERRYRGAVLAGVTIVALVLAVWSFTDISQPSDPSVVRSILPLPEGESLALFVTGGASTAISADGRYVAYATGDTSSGHLYLRALDSFEARNIEAGSRSRTPFFSPDGEWMGLVDNGQTLMRTAVSGGAAIPIFDLGAGFYGVTWSRHGIVFARGGGSGLFRIPPNGQAPEVLTRLDETRREKSHRFPQVLPGGEWVLFTVGTSTTDSWNDGLIAVGSMTTGEHRIVLEGGVHARYSRTGHLVYARAGNLLAVPFDLERMEVTGQPVTVVNDVMMSPVNGAAEYALSENGTLVYAPGRSHADDRAVVWVDREGRSEPLIDAPQPFTAPRLSPDGRYLALHLHGGLDSIVVYDVARETFERLTTEWDNITPLWSPSGQEIAFASARASDYDLYIQGVDRDDEARRVVTSEFSKVPTSWSPDGSILAFQEARGGEAGDDLFLLHLKEGPTREPFLESRANERWAMFSPNGEWIAYQSDETGQFQIYVCHFPDCDSKRPVSTAGGTYPVWDSTGKELFYRSGDKLMTVSVETEGDLVLGTPRALFERSFGRTRYDRFDVSPDGERFVLLDDSVAEPSPTHLVLVQNFDEELKRLVPTKE